MGEEQAKAAIARALVGVFRPYPDALSRPDGEPMTEQYQAPMRRALELALRGPAFGVNPQVGAVILDASGAIIAEGWHEGSGTPHAEVAALSKLSAVPEGATAVVTLEPCNHTGRTGPCAQALIDAGISRVVFAVPDPGQASAGGAETLRAAGIEVLEGIERETGESQLKVWLTAMRQQRPFVTLKWASTLDGRAAATDGTSQWISGPESRAHAHEYRAIVDAILVGTATAIADNPSLTARKPDGSLYEHQPLRVVLGERDLEPNLQVFDSAAPSVHLKTRNLTDALTALWDRGVRHLLVEGGPSVASQFIQAGLVNRYLVYLAPMLLGGERTALQDIGVATMTEAKHLRFATTTQLGQDLLITAESES